MRVRASIRTMSYLIANKLYTEHRIFGDDLNDVVKIIDACLMDRLGAIDKSHYISVDRISFERANFHMPDKEPK